MGRINVRLDPQLKERLKAVARAEGVSASEVVRSALREHLKARKPLESCLDSSIKPMNAYQLAEKLGILGSVKDLPSDLSTNPAYMEGFGE